MLVGIIKKSTNVYCISLSVWLSAWNFACGEWMLCTLLTGEGHRLLYALSSLNRFLHQSWGNKLQTFTRAVLLFQVALDCFVSMVYSGERMTEHCLFASQLLPFQVLNRFVYKAYSVSHPIVKWQICTAKLILLIKLNILYNVLYKINKYYNNIHIALVSH